MKGRRGRARGVGLAWWPGAPVRQMQSKSQKAASLQVIPYTLAENAGLNPIDIVSQLRSLHAQGQREMGINVKKGTVTNMREQKVVQPVVVTRSALQLATEAVRMILKIDDIVPVR